MKGIVFNLLEDAVRDSAGPDAWEDVLDAAGVDGAYTALGNYPDAELAGLVKAICTAQGAPADEVLRGFGRAAMPRLAERYPEFFTPHASTKPFLLTLDRVIHREVVKLYPGAQPPRMDFEDTAPDTLVMHYHSARRLCDFAEGMLEGAAAHYGEPMRLEHPICTSRGADHCVIVATFG